MRWQIGFLVFAAAIPFAHAQDMPLSQVLIDGEGWKVAAKDYKLIHDLESYVRLPGETAVEVRHSEGRDQILSSGQTIRMGGYPRLSTWWLDQRAGVSFHIYTADSERKLIEAMPSIGKFPKTHIIEGLARPSGVAVSADGSTLFVGDADGKYIWAFRIHDDGVLKAGQPYGLLRTRPGASSGVRRLHTDTDGRIYALTNLGVQILDSTGRLCGVLTNPADGPLVGLAFGGEDGKSLHIASKTTVYVRKVRSQGLGFAKPK
jgi:gluconolactonase